MDVFYYGASPSNVNVQVQQVEMSGDVAMVALLCSMAKPALEANLGKVDLHVCLRKVVNGVATIVLEYDTQGTPVLETHVPLTDGSTMTVGGYAMQPGDMAAVRAMHALVIDAITKQMGGTVKAAE